MYTATGYPNLDRRQVLVEKYCMEANRNNHRRVSDPLLAQSKTPNRSVEHFFGSNLPKHIAE